MLEPNLRMSEAGLKGLRKLCAPSFTGNRDREYGAIGLIGKRSVDDTLRELTVTEILWPHGGDVVSHPGLALTFASTYLRRAHLAVREKGLAGIVTFHTHPFSDKEVGFSWYDDEQDPLLIENLQDIWPSTWLASVVFGKESQQGRLWLSPAQQQPLARLISVGSRLRYLPLDGRQSSQPPTPTEIFDRGKAMTGHGALALLAGATAIVIGASGTGSLVCELLARAGCRRIIVIDPDVVKEANLNRILYATLEDAKNRTPKVDVLKRGIDALGLGCKVIPIFGSILDKNVMRRLNEGDFIVGCVDKDLPRMLLSKYAYQHLVPYVDVGAEIGGDKEGVVSVDARASYVAPDRWCLRCTGLVTARRLAFESLTASERKRKIALGYSDDLLLTQPAVMDLNMRAASAGTLILRHLLQPFLLEPLPVTLAENFVTYNMKPIEVARANDAACDICRANPQAGFGDCGEAIGFEQEIADALIDRSANRMANSTA
jgi:ThiF family